MGDRCCCCPFPQRNYSKKIVLLLVGLDNAGKTTAVKGLAGEFVQHSIPTVGFSSIQLRHRGCSVVIYDLGGGLQIRALWRSYFCDVHGVIFVVDASDASRIEECKHELENMLRNEKLAGKPVLILANKQDMPGAMDEIDIVEALKLEPLVNEQKCLTLVEVCSAKIQNSGRKKIDPRLLNGYRWLLSQVIRDYRSLNARVEFDSKEEAIRIEEQRELWRQRLIQDSSNSSMFIPDNIQNGSLSKVEHGYSNASEWAYRNGVEKHSPPKSSATSSSEAGEITRGVKEQLERKSVKQRHKMTLMRRNRVSPHQDDLTIAVHYLEREGQSLAVKALTSPRVQRPKELPPLRSNPRPSTSKSLGNDAATAWDLDKDLEVVDTLNLNSIVGPPVQKPDGDY